MSKSPRRVETPFRWLLVEAGDEVKVFATWTGGYFGSDSWLLNSGIERVEKDGDWFHFHGHSGSIYECHKDGYGTTSYGSCVIFTNGLKPIDNHEQYLEDMTK